MIIKNGVVFNEQCVFEKKDIYIENGIITEKDKITDYKEIDAENNYIIPALIDTHIHGAMGKDFCDADFDGLIEMARYLKKNGIGAFCPTSMTLDKNELKNIFETTKKQLPSDCAKIIGIHMEGPFISKEKKGAQNEKFIINPNLKVFNELNECCNNMIKIVTIDPDLPNSSDFIKEVSKISSISVGHTTSNYENTKNAFNLGAKRVTHLFNAMPPFNHREPSVVGASFDTENIFVELICDGIHIHPSVIRAVFKLFDNRVILISDCIRATGMKNGNYDLGGQKVILKNNKVTLENGTIAGSATNLFDCLRFAVSCGIPLESAIKSCTVTPAKSINIYDKMGSISVGKIANLVIMDKNLSIKKII